MTQGVGRSVCGQHVALGSECHGHANDLPIGLNQTRIWLDGGRQLHGAHLMLSFRPALKEQELRGDRSTGTKCPGLDSGQRVPSSPALCRLTCDPGCCCPQRPTVLV